MVDRPERYKVFPELTSRASERPGLAMEVMSAEGPLGESEVDVSAFLPLGLVWIFVWKIGCGEDENRGFYGLLIRG